MTALLKADDVHFAYGVDPVLAGVSLELKRGEMAALLGPNGAGKSTLLRLLAGLVEPSRGRVFLDGVPLDTLARRERAKRVAMLPQESEVPPAWLVEELVALGRTPFLSWLGGLQPEDDEAVEAALEATNTSSLRRRSFGSLSGGQKQRCLLALVLAQQPQLLLLDEPTTHLDIRYQAAVLDLIDELRERCGLTVLASLHDPSLAAVYFPRLLLLDRVLIADGEPDEVLTEQLLERTYGVRVSVVRHPDAGPLHVAVVRSVSRSVRTPR